LRPRQIAARSSVEPAMCSRVQPCSSQIRFTCSNWTSHSSSGPSSSTISAEGTPIV
jgi:hypothetical protein